MFATTRTSARAALLAVGTAGFLALGAGVAGAGALSGQSVVIGQHDVGPQVDRALSAALTPAGRLSAQEIRASHTGTAREPQQAAAAPSSHRPSPNTTVIEVDGPESETADLDDEAAEQLAHDTLAHVMRHTAAVLSGTAAEPSTSIPQSAPADRPLHSRLGGELTRPPHSRLNGTTLPLNHEVSAETHQDLDARSADGTASVTAEGSADGLFPTAGQSIPGLEEGLRGMSHVDAQTAAPLAAELPGSGLGASGSLSQDAGTHTGADEVLDGLGTAAPHRTHGLSAPAANHPGGQVGDTLRSVTGGVLGQTQGGQPAALGQLPLSGGGISI